MFLARIRDRISSSLTAKLGLFVAMVMIASLFVFSGVFIASEYVKVRSDILSQGKIFASFTAKAIYQDYVDFYTHPTQEDFANFKQRVEQKLSLNPDVVRVRLVSRNGTVLFDTEEFAQGKYTGPSKRTDESEATLDLVTKETLSFRNVLTVTGEDGIAMAMPLEESGGGHILSMVYEVSSRSLASRMNEIFGQIAITVLPLLGASVMLAGVFSFSITRPLVHLTETTKKLEEGNFDITIQTDSLDEIGILATSFTHMAQRLKASYKELEQTIEELKQKNIALVAARDEIGKAWMDLRREKAKLDASIERLAFGCIMVDAEKQIFFMNASVKTMLPKDVLEQKAVSGISKYFGEGLDIAASITRCQETRRTVEFADVVVADKHFHVYFTPIMVGAANTNEYVGTVIMIEDITETKLVERSKDEFFSIASHELRTPLTAIRGNASMILDMFGDDLKDEDAKHMLADINEASVRLIGIVNDFLDVSRLEQGKGSFNLEPIDFVGLIGEVVKELATSARDQKTMLAFDPPMGTTPKVLADSIKARQVLTNVIGNAIKYTQNGRVSIAVTREGDFLRCKVTDTGRGIAKAQQALLFRKFQQAGESLLTRDTTKGTGLGLYISRLLVEAMGGTISLENSIEGKGSVFSFTLPIGTQEHRSKEKKANEHINIDTGLSEKTDE